MKNNIKTFSWIRKLIPFVLLVIIILSFSIFAKHIIKDNLYVAKINNEKISIEEFKQQISLERSNVYSYFKIKYNMNNDSSFWRKTYKGESPEKKIKYVALQNCIRIKLQQILAKKYSIIKSIDYSSFIKQLKLENKKRYQDYKDGKVIYGPIKYDINSYSNDYYNKMIINLKDKLVQNYYIKFSNNDLKKYYDDVKKDYYKKDCNLVIEKIVLQYFDKDGNVNINKKNDMFLEAKDIKNKLQSGENFEVLAYKYNTDEKLKMDYGRQEFNDNTIKNISLYNNTLEEAARTLKNGQVYDDIIDAGDSYNIIKCIYRENDQYKAFDDVKEDVKQKYIDKEYNAIIENLEKSSHIKINTTVYNWIKIE